MQNSSPRASSKLYIPRLAEDAPIRLSNAIFASGDA